MRLIVGLGNPGVEYETTRHNLGFMVVGVLAEKLSIELKERSLKSIWGEGTIEENEVVLARPTTFVNSSGESVRALIEKFGVEHEGLIVIHDDLDLPLGDVRAKTGGGSGGHNGLQSIIDKLGNGNFARSNRQRA